MVLGGEHAFNGHNNEVGGAARIERFKQFIRFKVEPNQITGYVITFDDPQTTALIYGLCFVTYSLFEQNRTQACWKGGVRNRFADPILAA